MRVRKNIDCLSVNELHDLREAFAAIYQLPESNPKSFSRIAGLHGLPSPSFCNHNSTAGFLSWHRAYLLELENALRDFRGNVTIPYWDWNSTSDNGIPAACKLPTYVNRNGATVANPLFRGPIASSAGGGFTSRRADINTLSFADLATAASANQSETNFNTYASTLNGIHGTVHVRFNGSMSSVDLAAFDPIFYFHHANIDKLWASWQALTTGTMPASESNSVLQPFTRPFTNVWHTGTDFERVSDWNYSYRYWCFMLPSFPWPLRRLRIPIEPWIFNANRINLVVRSEKMLMTSLELRVFVNDEKANAETPIIDNPNYAGSIGIFGMGKAHITSVHGHQAQKHQLDITKCLRSCIKKRDKNLKLNLVVLTGNGKPFDNKKVEALTIELEAL